MTAPGEVHHQAVVNVRTCGYAPNPGDVPWCEDGPVRCPGCQDDGTWLDTSNPTMVERMDADGAPDPDGYYFRPVENGDTDGE